MLAKFDIHEELPVQRPRLGLGLSLAASVVFGALVVAEQPPSFKVWLAIQGAIASAVGVKYAQELKELEPHRIIQKEARLNLLSEQAALQATAFRPASMQQNQLMESAETTEAKSPELFDWNRFNTERDDFPHIIIAGKTGGGKSYLAEYLASLFEGFTIAVSPHWKKGDFTSADLVIGWGRNTGGAAQFEHSFADILTGDFTVSVGGFMYALLQEMDRRYQLDPVTQEYVGANDPEIVVILDEFNLYANMDGLPIITKQLLREARKVRIRLIPLVQGTEVKALGVEGEGQLREQLTFIRVRNKAVELVNQEINKHRNDEFLGYWQGVKNFVSSSRYACFVDGIPAQIPDLTEWKQLQPPLANLAGFDVQSVDGVDDIDLLKRCYSMDSTQFQHTTRIDDNCPGCESTHISPHGKTRAGTPRQRCNDCGKTWTIK